MTSRVLTNGFVRSVAVVGGTHGNEISGVHLVKHLQNFMKDGPKWNFKTSLILANTRAIKANTRYVDMDLNRCFLLKDLEKDYSVDDPALSWEELRAQQLNSMMGPKGSANPKVDFIIDLHNTTSNSGIALMMNAHDDFSHEVAAHLQTKDADVRVCNWSTDSEDHSMLPTVARSGLTFEVGPVPWGVLDARLLQQSKRLLFSALQYIHTRNAQMATATVQQQQQPAQSLVGHAPMKKTKRDYISRRAINSVTDSVTDDKFSETHASGWTMELMSVYRRAAVIGFPPSTPAGPMLIHPQMQGRDFIPLAIGDPVFVDIDGQTIIPFSPSHPFWATQEDFPGFDEPLYPFFINEAAYYEKNVAFALAWKKKRPVRVMKEEATPSSFVAKL